MAGTELEFSFNMEGIDRKALLAEAAESLNALRGVLGSRQSGEPETPEAQLTREFQKDNAEFAAFPDVYKITDNAFLSVNRPVPVPFKQLSKDYDFYWLKFPILLFPRTNWVFNKLEVRVEFNQGGLVPHARPKAYQILPNKNFQTLLEISESLEVRLDENFQVSAKTGQIKGEVGTAKVELDVAAGAKLAGGIGLAAGRLSIASNAQESTTPPPA